MKKGLMVLAVLGLQSVALAASNCTPAWTVQVDKKDSFLTLKLREAQSKGPACDLVVKNLVYLAGVKTLALDIAPVEYCPVDAVAARQATLQWQLPLENRNESELRLVINGKNNGLIRLERTSVQHEGVCK